MQARVVLGSASIFNTKIILKIKFSNAGGLFLKTTLETACAQNCKVLNAIWIHRVQMWKTFYELSKYQTIWCSLRPTRGGLNGDQNFWSLKRIFGYIALHYAVDRLNLQLSTCMVCLCKYHNSFTNLFSLAFQHNSLSNDLFVWDVISNPPILDSPYYVFVALCIVVRPKKNMWVSGFPTLTNFWTSKSRP